MTPSLTIRPLGAKDVNTAEQLLTSSMDVEPIFTTIYDNSVKRRKVVRIVLGDLLSRALAKDLAIGAFDGDQLKAVAIWGAPGSYPPSRMEWLKDLPLFFRLARFGIANAVRLARMESNTHTAFPDMPLWYLETLAVDPTTQGMGVGSAFMRGMMETADREQRTCYLETGTEANVRFYTRQGFEVLDPAAQLIPDGQTHWTMIRHPQEPSR